MITNLSWKHQHNIHGKSWRRSCSLHICVWKCSQKGRGILQPSSSSSTGEVVVNSWSRTTLQPRVRGLSSECTLSNRHVPSLTLLEAGLRGALACMCQRSPWSQKSTKGTAQPGMSYWTPSQGCRKGTNTTSARDLTDALWTPRVSSVTDSARRCTNQPTLLRPKNPNYFLFVFVY